MNSMDDRKFRILQAIIDDYILTAVPVGSRTISKKYDMGLSSATIRNEMSDLEELGYLDQPHVSAGRIPSAKAYRLYVDQLLTRGKLQINTPEAIQAHFTGRVHQMEDVIDRAAQVLSSLTNYTAVVLPPSAPQPRIRNLQLVPVSDTSALLVLVTDSSIVRDMVFRIPERMDPDTLYAISRMLTEQLHGKTPREAAETIPLIIQSVQENSSLLESLGLFFSQNAEQPRPRHVGVGGTSRMLNYPEYNDVEKARAFLSLMESPNKLASIIKQQGDLAFTVRIGPETGVPEMQDCSIVTATYATQNGQQGTIGVIGPTRMQYSRVLSILDAMGRELTDLFSEEGRR